MADDAFRPDQPHVIHCGRYSINDNLYGQGIFAGCRSCLLLESQAHLCHDSICCYTRMCNIQPDNLFHEFNLQLMLSCDLLHRFSFLRLGNHRFDHGFHIGTGQPRSLLLVRNIYTLYNPSSSTVSTAIVIA